ncbi:hypothetical protein [Pseudonocardia sp. GCM10023141]|uniref:hypothetical protein n=1 Tax=Pseudonocardia sp. GCM10023141 TaxID=3252653 RepID=UPI00361740BE
MVDRWQRHGIGAALLAALGAVAAENGLDDLRAELTTQTHALAELFGRVFPGTRTSWAGSLIRVSCPVRPADTPLCLGGTRPTAR